jgi:hypothetical protein
MQAVGRRLTILVLATLEEASIELDTLVSPDGKLGDPNSHLSRDRNERQQFDELGTTSPCYCDLDHSNLCVCPDSERARRH